jgi:hypothetical protein
MPEHSQSLVPVSNETFYELAWKVRRDLVERWCAEPGANALRVLKRLELHEARYQLVLDRVEDTRTGTLFFTGAHRWTPYHNDPAGQLPTGVPPFVTVAMRDREVTLPFYADLGGIAARWLAHHCQDHAYDAIVELGCGTGRNIFSLFYNGGPRGPYYAAELTASGRDLVQRLAGLEPAMALTVVPFDHKAPDLSFLPPCRRLLIFSVHSIEQIATLPADYFDVLARAAETVTGLHFEPFGFQLGRQDAVAVRQRQWFASHGWNGDLLDRLKDADKRGVIHMTFLSDNLYGTTLENPTSVAIWENVCGAG